MHVRSFQLSDVSPVTDLLQTALSEECFENTIEPFSGGFHGIQISL